MPPRRSPWDGVGWPGASQPPATQLDDEQARELRLPLLGKGAVFAHQFERPLTAGMDDDRQLDRDLFGRGVLP